MGFGFYVASDAGEITGSGTTNTVAKFTSANTIGDSNITDNGTLVSINSRAVIAPPVATSGTPTGFLYTGAAHTTLTASTEFNDFNINLKRTVQFATGAIGNQRAIVIQQPVYAFVGASTITNSATLYIEGAPVASTNATITNPYAFWIDDGNVRFDGSLSVGTGSPPTAVVTVSASTTARASINMALGTAPTTPNAGDVYFAGAPGSDAFYMYGGNLILSKTATNSSIFNYSNTAQRTYTFPDASGTVLFGTGTANTIAKFSDANTVADSQIVDDGTNITGTAASGLITWVGGSGGVLSYTSTDRAIYVGNNILGGSFNKYIQVQTASTTISHVTTIAISSKAVTFTQQVNTSGSPTAWLFTGGAHTTLTAATEAIDVNYNLARTVQFATGAIATQRAYLIQAPTYGFVGASTITDAATFAISAAPTAGTNATITNAYALWVQAGRSQFDGAINGLTITSISAATVTFTTGTTITMPAATSTVLANNLGITGGTTLIGDTAASGNLTLNSTSNATKGFTYIGASTSFSFDETNIRFGVGIAAPTSEIHISKTVNGDVVSNIANLSTGTAGRAINQLSNSANTVSQIFYSTGFTTAGLIAANQWHFTTSLAAGMLFSSTNAAGVFKWSIAGTAAGDNMMQLGVAGLGINKSGSSLTAPVSALEVNGIGTTSSVDGIRLRQPNVATGMTSLSATDTYGQISWVNTTAGGMLVQGLSDTDSIALNLTGTVGATSTTIAAIFFNGRKKNGTTSQALAATETLTQFSNSGTIVVTILASGATFLGGTTSPTAILHITAGTTAAGSAPLKFVSGTSMTTAEAGAMEFTTDDLFFTITTGAARKRLLMADDVGGLTSGRVPFATTNGRLTDDADMTFATDTLTVTKIVGSTSIKVGSVAGYISSDGSTGATGTITAATTATVKDGIITAIV